VDVVVHQILDIGVATDKPEQLVDNTLEENLLGGKEWETLTEVETSLGSKDPQGVNAGTVFIYCTLAKDPIDQIQVGQVMGHRTVK
jgi:hypothetical protein